MDIHRIDFYFVFGFIVAGIYRIYVSRKNVRLMLAWFMISIGSLLLFISKNFHDTKIFVAALGCGLIGCGFFIERKQNNRSASGD